MTSNQLDRYEEARSRVPATRSSSPTRPGKLERETNGILRELEHQTVRRVAKLEADALVTARQIRRTGELVSEAITCVTINFKQAEMLGGSDPVLLDELMSLARAGKLTMGQRIFEFGSE